MEQFQLTPVVLPPRLYLHTGGPVVQMPGLVCCLLAPSYHPGREWVKTQRLRSRLHTANEAYLAEEDAIRRASLRKCVNRLAQRLRAQLRKTNGMEV